MRPFTLLIKPSGPDCNLACKYCFYTCKTSVFGTGRHRMSGQVLNKLIKDYITLDFVGHSFAWQGGEPTVMGLDFYKKVVSLQKQHSPSGRSVSNALQTNAVLLDEKWCSFLSEYNFLVGISLDGPKKIHDYYRLDHAGNGTFDRVVAAIEKCRAHSVQFNVLVLLNNKNVICPDELFDFFTELKIKYLQFVPCVEKDPKTGNIADYSITPGQFGDFLCRVFDRWRQYGPRKLSVRIFDSILSFYIQGRHTNCTFSPKCDDYIVIEHNGDAFACDFFVQPDCKLGSILQTPIEELAHGTEKMSFARRKQSLCNACLVCRYLDICRGGCLKDRAALTDSYDCQSYFCPAYKKFFDYSLPAFVQIAAGITQNTERPTREK